MKLRTAKILVRLGWWGEIFIELFGFRTDEYLCYQQSDGSPCAYYVRDNSGVRAISWQQVPEGRFVRDISDKSKPSC